ncbi:hypothetical protein ACFQZU_07100, partial [Streptomonospora algeriensis]
PGRCTAEERRHDRTPRPMSRAPPQPEENPAPTAGLGRRSGPALSGGAEQVGPVGAHRSPLL